MAAATLSVRELAAFRDLDRRLMLALVNRDASALAALMDADHAAIHADGSALDAAAMLADLPEAPATPFERWTDNRVSQVRRYGDTAIITALATFVEGPLLVKLRYVQVWVKRRGAWRLAHWQATTVTAPGTERERRLIATRGAARPAKAAT